MATKSTAKRAHERSGQARGNKPLPEIPDKLYYRIGEVARLCAVETYVLRFWETEFPQLKPNKSGSGQRLYRRREVDLARRIRHLLYEEGYTIPGARQAFHAEGKRPAESAPAPRTADYELPLARAGLQAGERTPRLGRLRTELKEILGMLSTAPAAANGGRPPRPAAAKTERRELFD